MLQPEVRCIEFVESVTDWMEGALGDEARVAVEEHLVICPHCLQYVDQLRAAVSTLGVERPAPPGEVDDALRSALLEAFRRRD